MTGGTGCDWVVEALFVNADPDRLHRLAQALRTRKVDWAGLVERLSYHRVLPLVRRNLVAAGVAIPAGVAGDLEEREAEFRHEARRGRLTLERFLACASARRLEVVLLKGASLCLDVYPDPALRHRSDLDVLVDSDRVPATLAAAHDAGFVTGEKGFPVWWYRLVHFHVSLRPVVSLMTPLEIHWQLHSPAQLLTITPAQLKEKLREIRVGPFRAWTLDPVDRLLHLATHLFRHGHHIPASDGEAWILALLRDATRSVHLLWVVDLTAAAERMAASTSPRALVRRAESWGAETNLARALDLIAACPMAKPTEDWVRRVEDELGQVGRVEPTLGFRPPEAPRPADAAMHFRLEQLNLLPRWIWPPGAYVRRRYRLPSSPFLGSVASALMRPIHAIAVLFRAGLAVATIPIALLCRRCLRSRRRRLRTAALRPAQLIDVASQWKALLARTAEREAGPADRRDEP